MPAADDHERANGCTYREIEIAHLVKDGAYDTRLCHDKLRRKKSARLSLPGRERFTGLMSMQTATVLLRISV